jgi:NAD+ diphosphatase
MNRESIYKHYVPAVASDPGDSGAACWFVFSSNRLLLETKEGSIGLPFLNRLADLDLQPLRTQYLGMLQGHPCYSAELKPEMPAPSGMSFKDLRSVSAPWVKTSFFWLAKLSR